MLIRDECRLKHLNVATYSPTTTAPMRWLLLGLGCTLLFAWAPISTALASVGGEQPVRESVSGQDWYMVTDRAGVLDQERERLAINDAYRLYLHGIPTQVVTEYAVFSQNQADARARELRITNRIESSRGANDGLLLYAAVNPRNRASIVTSISVGGTTLPINGLTPGSLEDVHNNVIAPQLGAGRPAQAIIYGLRKIIYLEQYAPPAVTPVTGWHAGVRRALDILGPIIALMGSVWVIRQRAVGSLAARSVLVSLAAGGSIVIGVAILAIPSQSTIGVYSALVLGVVLVWRAIEIDTLDSSPAILRMTVTPRVPGSRAVSARRSRVGSR
jgi:hypothetical protein